MNLLLFTSQDRLDDTRIEIRGARLSHLSDVQSIKTGDQLRVGEIDGLLGKGTVLEISAQHAIIETRLSDSPPPKAPLILVLALPRPKMLRRILRGIAEMGVAELHLVNSYRVQKSYWQSPLLNEDKFREYLLQGLSQSVDTCLPPVVLHHRFKPFVEDTFPTLSDGRQCLLAQPGDHPACPREITGDTVLVVGPEGGYIPYEIDKLAQAGCKPVSLGPRILRVETAVAALLGRLALP